LPTIRIKPIENPVDELPHLPQRESKAVDFYDQVRDEVQDVRAALEGMGGQIDIAADGDYLDCELFFNLYHETAQFPELNVTQRVGALTEWGAEQYNEAIAQILDTSQPLYHTCGAALKGEAKSDIVPEFQAALSRRGVDEGMRQLEGIINRLDEEDLDLACEVIESQLEAMHCTGKEIQRLGGEMDIASNTGYIKCSRTVEAYDAIVNAPTFDYPTNPDTYALYRHAIEIVKTGSYDVASSCRVFLEEPENSKDVIPFQMWSVGRVSVNDALEILDPAIDQMEKQP